MRRFFGPLPLLLLGLSLGLGWASFPLWQASNQFSEGMRVCYERVNLSLIAHTLKIKKSEFLGASFFQGTEECWGELVSLLSSSGVATSQVTLQKSNEIALEIHKFNLAMANGQSNTKTVLEYWNPLRESIDQLRELISSEKEIGLQRIKDLAGGLSLAFFVFTFFSWMRSRRSRKEMAVPLSLETPIETAAIEKATKDDSTVGEQVEPSILKTSSVSTDSPITDNAPAIEVATLLQLQTQMEVATVTSEHITNEMVNEKTEVMKEITLSTQPASAEKEMTHEEVVATSDVAAVTEVVSDNKQQEVAQIETVAPFKQQIPVLSMGEYIEKLLQDQSDHYFLQGIFVKKQILKDFPLAGNAESFQNGLFYLMNLHGWDESSPGKTIQIILRESAGQICLSVQSGPVKNWEGDNINLILATEALKDAGLNLEWEMSFLGAQSNLVTTCRAPIPSTSMVENTSSNTRLTRLMRGTKSQLQKRLRDLAN